MGKLFWLAALFEKEMPEPARTDNFEADLHDGH